MNTYLDLPFLLALYFATYSSIADKMIYFNSALRKNVKIYMIYFRILYIKEQIY